MANMKNVQIRVPEDDYITLNDQLCLHGYDVQTLFRICVKQLITNGGIYFTFPVIPEGLFTETVQTPMHGNVARISSPAPTKSNAKKVPKGATPQDDSENAELEPAGYTHAAKNMPDDIFDDCMRMRMNQEKIWVCRPGSPPEYRPGTKEEYMEGRFFKSPNGGYALNMGDYTAEELDLLIMIR